MKYLLIALLLLPFSLNAKNLAVATHDDVRVYLTDEPCEISAVSNLPFKAIWKEPKGEVKGCWGPFGPIVGLYFEYDKSVAVIPAHVFQRVQEI